MPSVRVSRKNDLTPQEYSEAMMMELESADDRRIQAFNNMLIQKNKVAQTYNKRIKRKSFEVGEVVWKIILAGGSKDKELGKRCPNWERPFKVHQVLLENSYVRKPTRGATQEVHQWEILEEVFPYHVENCKKFPKELG